MLEPAWPFDCRRQHFFNWHIAIVLWGPLNHSCVFVIFMQMSRTHFRFQCVSLVVGGAGLLLFENKLPGDCDGHVQCAPVAQTHVTSGPSGRPTSNQESVELVQVHRRFTKKPQGMGREEQGSRQRQWKRSTLPTARRAGRTLQPSPPGGGPGRPWPRTHASGPAAHAHAGAVLGRRRRAQQMEWVLTEALLEQSQDPRVLFVTLCRGEASAERVETLRFLLQRLEDEAARGGGASHQKYKAWLEGWNLQLYHLTCKERRVAGD